MKYTGDIDFNALEPGTVVLGVPTNHAIFGGVYAYMNPRRERPKWKKRVTDLIFGFDEEKCGPLYYCLNCQRIEDGAHRFDMVVNYLGNKAVNVKTGAICWKGIRGDLYHMFDQKMERMGISGKDRDWLKACAESKWPYLGGVDFKGKNVLDIGTQTGFTCFKAIQHGAKAACGIDTRADILEVGIDLKHKLGAQNILLVDGSLEQYESIAKWDIVLCMGLIHYFGIDLYKKMLEKLAGLTGDYLILELRVEKSHEDKLIQRKQVIATLAWLDGWAHRNNLRVEKRVERDEGRGLWIFRKRK